MLRDTFDYDISISIHALREEGDSRQNHKSAKLRISIHALREEGDLKTCSIGRPSSLFLSTPSARRATCPQGTQRKGV